MKIALTHMRHAEVGGTELFLNQIAKALAEKGHQVTIVCRSHKTPPHPKVQFVKLHPWAIGRGHRLWRFAKDVEQHVATHDYDLVFGLGRTWSQDVVRVGAGLYREQKGMGRAKWRLWPKDLVAEAIERRAFEHNQFKLLIANSNQTARSLAKQFHIPSERMVTIHNAVDISRFDPELRQGRGLQLREKCGFSRQDQVYLFLGSGYKRKGLDRLLRAFPLVLDNNPHARLLIVGFDSHLKHYKALAQKLGIAKQTVFLGGRKDVEHCYAAADCYVLPTRFDAFGFSVLEALASGLPVVITETAGAAEVVTPQVGQVLPSKHADTPLYLAAAMLKVGQRANSPALRESCRALAADYAVEPIMARNIQVLEAVAEQKRLT